MSQNYFLLNAMLYIITWQTIEIFWRLTWNCLHYYGVVKFLFLMLQSTELLSEIFDITSCYYCRYGNSSARPVHVEPAQDHLIRTRRVALGLGHRRVADGGLLPTIEAGGAMRRRGRCRVVGGG